jgi:hypothetical protein
MPNRLHLLRASEAIGPLEQTIMEAISRKPKGIISG